LWMAMMCAGRRSHMNVFGMNELQNTCYHQSLLASRSHTCTGTLGCASQSVIVSDRGCHALCVYVVCVPVTGSSVGGTGPFHRARVDEWTNGRDDFDNPRIRLFIARHGRCKMDGVSGAAGGANRGIAGTRTTSAEVHELTTDYCLNKKTRNKKQHTKALD